MHVGIANPRLRGKCSRHSRCIHNRQFCVSGKRPIYENLSPLITAWKPVRHQSTIWTNDNILSIGPLGAVVREYESKYKFDLRRCVRLCRLQRLANLFKPHCAKNEIFRGNLVHIIHVAVGALSLCVVRVLITSHMVFIEKDKRVILLHEEGFLPPASCGYS